MPITKGTSRRAYRAAHAFHTLHSCARYAQRSAPPREAVLPKTIDIHTHVLADATVKLMQKEIPSLGLKMAPYDADNAVCEVAGVAYRPLPRGGHDIERRFKDMDAAGGGVDLLLGGAQTWVYGRKAAGGGTAAGSPKQEIARVVKGHPEGCFRIA